jgi:hypothetical protein
MSCCISARGNFFQEHDVFCPRTFFMSHVQSSARQRTSIAWIPNCAADDDFVVPPLPVPLLPTLQIEAHPRSSSRCALTWAIWGHRSGKSTALAPSPLRSTGALAPERWLE